MAKVNNFFEWFQKLGGNLTDFDASRVFDKLNDITLKVSFLKQNANFIKENFNYKFKK